MDFVVDANIVFAAIIRRADTCELLFSSRLSLYAPEFLIKELEEHKKEILEKSGLSEEDFKQFTTIMTSRIKLFPFEDFQPYIQKAKKTTPDPEDIEYLALALKLNCPIWSNDKQLKKQQAVKVISTTELLNLVK